MTIQRIDTEPTPPPRWQSYYDCLHKKDKGSFIESFCNIEGITKRSFFRKKNGLLTLTRDELTFAEHFFGVNR